MLYFWYFLNEIVIVGINKYGNASGAFDDLKESLAKFWGYIGEQGSKENFLLMPVLGSGSARISEPREKIVLEIIFVNEFSFSHKN